MPEKFTLGQIIDRLMGRAADEPTADGVHVDAVMGGKGKARGKLPAPVADETKGADEDTTAADAMGETPPPKPDPADGDDGELDDDGEGQFDDDNAGGTSADNAPKDNTKPNAKGMSANLADMCARKATDQSQTWGLLIKIRRAAETPAWITYLPKPGSYEHPAWGTVEISRARNQRFCDNFNAHVYQEKIPIDLEHQTKLSGAAGWIDRMRMNPDGSVSAHSEWTDRGRFFIENNRFFYFSPEWYDEWQQPDTQKVFADVAIGGALTTRPFFKEASLKPLVASESGGLYAPMRRATNPSIVDVGAFAPRTTNTRQEADTMPQLTDEQFKQFTEMQERDKTRQAAEEAHKAEVASLKAANESNATALKAATERIEKQEKAARHARFASEVLGKSDANGKRWIGDTANHVAMMEHLADTTGEDGPLLKSYIESQRATAELVSKSKLFAELGRDGAGVPLPKSATEQITEKASALITATPALGFAEAVGQVAKANPGLYAAYVDESRKRGS